MVWGFCHICHNSIFRTVPHHINEGENMSKQKKKKTVEIPTGELKIRSDKKKVELIKGEYVE